MVFNSFEFALFFGIIFLLYWFVFSKTKTSQNILLLISSLVFFGWTDWRFLSILIFNILFNYFLAKKIFSSKKERTKQHYLWFGVIVNIGVLGYYKYFNFFCENLLSIFDPGKTYSSLEIIIPLGISFFTFQTLGYIIDVFYEEIEPYDDLLVFSTYVGYFPKILSGPIERAQAFIPQILNKRVFSYDLATDGLRQILWGLFAKIVIAENCAVIVNPVFDNYESEGGSTLLIVSFFYMIQLYADFSGYSNMAIGFSKLLGIKLSKNFATPFFSTNISEFWRKWHISLTTWIMDYIFTPLSFMLRNYKKKGLMISIITTFLIVGLWHGANWTFVLFGLIHGIYFIPLVFSGSMNKSTIIIAENKYFPSIFETFKMLILFLQVMFAAVFFRSETVTKGAYYIKGIFSNSLISAPSSLINGRNIAIVGFIGFFLFIEWLNRARGHDFEISNRNIYLRRFFYVFIFLIILIFGRSSDGFIYFQF